MRMRYPSISDAVDQVLREVAAEDHVKTAERQIIRDALNPQTKTHVAHQLTKLAACCRGADDDNPEVSYQDLQNFMAQVNAR